MPGRAYRRRAKICLNYGSVEGEIFITTRPLRNTREMDYLNI